LFLGGPAAKIGSMQISPESPAWNAASPASEAFPPLASDSGREPEASGTKAGRIIRTLIADDQSVCRVVLERLLKQEPDIEIVGTFSGGREAVEAINQLLPDLVFLDVEMPDLDGFGVVQQIQGPRLPVVIFVTSNQAFAVKAFDVQAVDYLLKPCRRDRLQTALQRVRAQLQSRTLSGQTTEIQQKLNSLLQALSSLSSAGEGRTDEAVSAPSSVPSPGGEARPEQALRPQAHGANATAAERLAVKAGGRIVLLRLADLDWAESADNYVKLHLGQETHLLRETLTALEAKLPPDRFLRISRSTIVNLERIKELHPLFHGEYVVVLRDGTQLTLTRSYRQKLRQLGLS